MPLAPKVLLRLEGLAFLIASTLSYQALGGSWLKYAALFLVPDLAMAGYAFGNRAGAASYNAVHSYVAPVLLWLLAYYGNRPALYSLGLIWTAHIGFDRLLGFGLKYPTAFKDTHLGRV